MSTNKFSRLFAILTITSVIAGCTTVQTQQTPQPIELRGVWLANVDSHVLESRIQISEAMQFLANNNFNVVYPVVWSNGFTHYRSVIMKQYFGMEIDTMAAYIGRDPLAELIEEAHKRNIAVIPAFEFGLSSSHRDNSGHILKVKPQWAARDREGKLLKKDGLEWMNAFHPEVQEFMFALVTEVVKKYDVDGVQGDQAQPIEGGYDSLTVALFKDTHAGNEPPPDFRENHWKYWRAVKLTSFAQQIFRRVKSIKSDVIVSWSPGVYPWSLEEYLQDWRSWINPDPYGNIYADIVHPRIFQRDIEQYKRTLDSQHRDSMRVNNRNRYLYPDIVLNAGTYTMSEEYLKESVRYNRYRGYNGEVFLSYEGLRKENDNLAKLLKETVYKTPARLPFTPAFQRAKVVGFD